MKLFSNRKSKHTYDSCRNILLINDQIDKRKKVQKKTKIVNRYNQVQHLTQDTIPEIVKNTRKHHIQESQEFSHFLTGDHKVARNGHDSMTKKHKQNPQKQTKNPKKIQKRNTALEQSVRRFTGELIVSQYQSHP